MRCKSWREWAVWPALCSTATGSVRRRMLTLNGHQKTTALCLSRQMRRWESCGSCCRKNAVKMRYWLLNTLWRQALSGGKKRHRGSSGVFRPLWAMAGEEIREGSCCGGGGSPGRGHPALVSVRGAIDAGWTAVRERVYWRAVKDAWRSEHLRWISKKNWVLSAASRKPRHASTVQHYYESINRGTRSQVSISPEALEPRVLRKGIFTKDVEDQAAIAKRLSHAVNDGFAGTIAMASQSAQNAKRARELQKTMDSQQKRLQSVTEPLRGFQRADDRNPDDGSAV